MSFRTAPKNRTPHIIRYAYVNLKVINVRRGPVLVQKWNAECTICGIVIQECAGTTSGFVRHIRIRHPNMYMGYIANKGSVTVKTEPLDSYVDSLLETGAQAEETKSNQIQDDKDAFNSLFVKCPLPLSLADNQNFLEFLQGLNPAFVPPAIADIRNFYVPSMFEDALSKVKLEFSSAKFVTVTLNFWCNGECTVMAVTGNFVQDFRVSEGLLCFQMLMEKDALKSAVLKLNEIFEGFSLKGKIIYHIINKSAAVFDTLDFFNSFIRTNKEYLKPSTLLEYFREDGSNHFVQPENSMLPYVGDIDCEGLWKGKGYFEDSFVKILESEGSENIECFQTSLLLVLRDGFKGLDVAVCRILNKFCNLIDVLSKHGVLAEYSGNFKLNRDDHGWLRLYADLYTVDKMDANQLRDLLENLGYSGLTPTDLELENLHEFTNVLSPFAEIIQLLKSSQCPTSSMVVPSVVSLHKMLVALLQDVHQHKDFVNVLLQSLKKRFCGLFERISLASVGLSESERPFNNFVYVLAAVVNPKYRFIWLDVDHPGSLVTKLQLKNTIIGSAIKMAEKLNLVNDGDRSQQSDCKSVSKKSKLSVGSVFASYQSDDSNKPRLTAKRLVESYLSHINEKNQTWEEVRQFEHFDAVLPLLQAAFCPPAGSPGVESVAASGGIFGQLNTNSCYNAILEQLAFIKCNERTCSV